MEPAQSKNLVVRVGSWLYAGSVPREVQIFRSGLWYGSGDVEDPPDIALDREVECFVVEFQTATGEPQWVGGGTFATIEDAIEAVGRTVGASLVWQA